jgi:hypothetical protein
VARDGSVIHDFTYGDSGEWPGRADGKGASLEYVGAGFTTGAYNLGSNWRASSEFHGTPAVAGSGAENSIVINEILNHANSPFLQAIELRNNTGSAIDLSGWYISNVGMPDDLDSFRQFRIPAGTTIQPGGSSSSMNATSTPTVRGTHPRASQHRVNSSFSLPGQRCLAYSGRPDWPPNPTGYACRVRGCTPRRKLGPLARWHRQALPARPADAIRCEFRAAPKPKLGAPNSAPRVGPLLISEIQHTPADGSVALEFVEIRNTGGSAQSLSNWRLRGDADFNFTTQALQPGGLLVVVPFAPTDAARTTAFRAAYQIAASVPLVGLGIPATSSIPRGCRALSRGSRAAAEPGVLPRTTEDW